MKTRYRQFFLWYSCTAATLCRYFFILSYWKLPGGGQIRQSARRTTQEEIDDIQSIPQKSINKFTSHELEKVQKYAKVYIKEIGTRSPFFRAWFGDWRAYDTSNVQIDNNIGNTCGIHKNTDTGWQIMVSGMVGNETKSHNDSPDLAAIPYLEYIDDIVKKAILPDSFSIPKGEAKSINSLLMHSMYSIADIGKGPEIIKLYAEEMNNPNSDKTDMRTYQLRNVERYRLLHGVHSNTASSISAGSGVSNVADLFAAVKSRDKKFFPNPVNTV